MFLFTTQDCCFFLFYKTHRTTFGLRAKVSFLLLFFCCSFSRVATAQVSKIDSLKNILSQYESHEDTFYLKSLEQLTYQLFLFQSDSATYYAKKLEVSSQKVDYLIGQAKSLKIQGLINRIHGNYKDALANYEKSLTLYQKLKNQKELGEVINEIGLVHNHLGSYPKALEYYYQSLEIAEKINDLPTIAANYNNIAGVSINQGNVEKALFFFEKSLEVNIKAQNKKGIARSYHNIGGIYIEQKKYNEAIACYYKTLEIEKEIDSRLISFETLTNIGYVYYYQEKYDTALDFFTESNRVAFEIGNDFIKILNYRGIADVYYSQKNYTESIKNAHLGLEIAKQKGIFRDITGISKLLYKNYKAQKSYQKALEYHEMYKENNDSIFNIEKTIAINNLESKAEVERKEKEIFILNKDKAILKSEKGFQQKVIYLVITSLLLMSLLTYFIYKSRLKERKASNTIGLQNKQLKVQNEEIQAQATKLAQINADKNRLFSIIGHDLRSPINSLTGLLGLLEKKQISAEEFLFFSAKLKGNVENVHFTLNNLLLWANSQMNGMSTKPTNFDLHIVGQENIRFLRTITDAKNIEVINEIPQPTTAFADFDQVALIFRNLISNAVKFTPSGGIVKLQAVLKDNLVQIAIKDNGVGMSLETQAGLFRSTGVSMPGTNKEKGTGLGLTLCKDFVEKNAGELWVESEEEVGSAFYFTLPV